jgi:malonate transporter and related proteins
MLLQLLLPIFLLTALGCLLAKTRLIADGWQAGLTELTARLLIPAFLFSGSYKNGIPASVSWQVLAAFFIPLLALFLVAAYAFGRDAPRALAATYSNTVFVGIPVILQAFGPASLQYAFPIIAFHGLIAFSLYYLAAPHGSGGAKVGKALFTALKNPIVTSLLLGLALNMADVALPAPVTGLLALLSGAALPCALLALGAALTAFKLQGVLETVTVVAAKLIVLPAAVFAVAVFVFRLPAPATAVLVAIAACPVGVNAAALVQADGKNASMVSSAILLSSLLCTATIPLWISIVRTL